MILYSLKNQIAKDNTRERERLIQVFLKGRPVLEFFYVLMQLSPVELRSAACLLYAMTSSAKWFSFSKESSLVITKHANERSRLRSILPVLNRHRYIDVEWNFSPEEHFHSLVFFIRQSLMSLKKAKQIFRILKRVNRRFPLYVAVRAAETVLCSVFLQDQFRRKKPQSLMISTEGNPHGSAVMGVGSTLQIPVVYFSHAVVSSNPRRLECKLGIFYGSSADQEWRAVSPSMTDSMCFGFKNQFQPIILRQPVEKICICLSKDSDPIALRVLLFTLSERFPSAALCVRPHPHNLLAPKSFQSWPASAVLSVGQTLAEDLRGASVAIAGYSTVLVECLMAGIPSVFIQDLDKAVDLRLKFIEEGMVYRSVDVSAPWSLDDLVRFYESAQWQARLAKMMNLDDTFEESLVRMDNALEKVLNEKSL